MQKPEYTPISEKKICHGKEEEISSAYSDILVELCPLFDKYDLRQQCSNKYSEDTKNAYMRQPGWRRKCIFIDTIF
jgi:hypothetical protein